jgi:DNA polymerase I-like protein with 3'-5' exonuclease and polymerase domains
MTSKLQFALFAPKSEWVPPAEFPSIEGFDEIAIDVETRDPHIKSRGPGWPRRDGEIVGFAVATKAWSIYLPVGHLGGGNLDRRLVLRWMKTVCESPADKVMHNAQYDLGWLRAEGLTVRGKVFDTMVAANLIDENRFSYSLNAVAYDYLGKVKTEAGLTAAAREFGVDPKGEMWKLPAMHVGPYAEGDAALTLELWAYLKTRIAQESLTTVWDLETRLLPCLVDMTARGIRFDLDLAERTKQKLLRRENEALAQLKAAAGFNVEIWAAQSIAKAFDAAGISYPRTDAGAPSFKSSFLSNHDHPLAKAIHVAREVNKVRGSFIDGLMGHVHNGRVHGHINQIRSDDGGTVTGRVSMSNPNLQQIPARNPEMGPLVRGLFLPEEGTMWAGIDFSQQEPRILVHYAALYGQSRNMELPGVSDFVRSYAENPGHDFHQLVADMAGISRKIAKVINLAMMYGMGVNKLAGELDLSVDEAKDLTKQYHERVPFVQALSKAVQNRVDDPRSEGSLRTLKGRKCRFDLWEPVGYEMHKALKHAEALAAHGPTVRLRRAMTYKALNRLIQGSAADMTKQAMVDVYEGGDTPLLQVHDELCFAVRDREHAERLAKTMYSAIPLAVPSKCDIALGTSWGNAAE